MHYTNHRNNDEKPFIEGQSQLLPKSKERTN